MVVALVATHNLQLATCNWEWTEGTEASLGAIRALNLLVAGCRLQVVYRTPRTCSATENDRPRAGANWNCSR